MPTYVSVLILFFPIQNLPCEQDKVYLDQIVTSLACPSRSYVFKQITDSIPGSPASFTMQRWSRLCHSDALCTYSVKVESKVPSTDLWTPNKAVWRWGVWSSPASCFLSLPVFKLRQQSAVSKKVKKQKCPTNALNVQSEHKGDVENCLIFPLRTPTQSLMQKKTKKTN